MLLQSGSLRCSPPLRGQFPAGGALVRARIKEPEATRRRNALRRVDRVLSKGNYKIALSLVRRLQGKPGGLRGFGAAKQVPRRISSLDELKTIGVDITSLQSLLDSMLNSIERSIEFQLSNENSILDLENLIKGSYESVCEDHVMCVQHEAGHFLVGYLLGVLPKWYKVSNVEAARKGNYPAGKVEFLGFEFLREVDGANILRRNFSSGKLCNRALNRFLCVLLGGLAAEHLSFGYSEGLHSDVEKLNRVLKWLGFTESEADCRVKWAAVNTLSILVRHEEARCKLAEAMALGRSVGTCIDIIEDTLNDNEI
ncbi:uncharacterized protein LOC127801776 isoform X2 [Diospyros lotus]|uniref:uncharacterized protein LOC127801776 isoform X2 n=1 Tax=Diospyros lotus TaxID=55363 RepID=UPI002254ED06|nr:uncharacterized protein LOC127801776 isoform X2 [Diospyros lotus]